MSDYDPREYTIPEGAIASPCKGCGEPIYWIKTIRGQNMPLNLDGTSHWATCPKAGEFRQKEDPRQNKFDFEEVTW